MKAGAKTGASGILQKAAGLSKKQILRLGGAERLNSMPLDAARLLINFARRDMRKLTTRGPK